MIVLVGVNADKLNICCNTMKMVDVHVTLLKMFLLQPNLCNCVVYHQMHLLYKTKNERAAKLKDLKVYVT